MAKGLRSKVKKRMRAARREHVYRLKGEKELHTLTQRLNDPTYHLKIASSVPPPNAFIEPNNPEATFPQQIKHQIWDFRSHKIAMGGYTKTNNFRKTNQQNAKQSKYPTIVRTIEEIEAEEQEQAMQIEESESEEEVEKKTVTVDDLNMEKLRLRNRNKKIGKQEVEMEVEMDPKVLKKTKAIQKKQKHVDNRRKRKSPAKIYRKNEHK